MRKNATHGRLAVLALAPAIACNPGGETGETTDSTGAATSTTTSTSTTTTSSDPTDGGCPAPLGLCDGECVDTEHDPAHCGGCGQPCAPGLACVAGQCGVACGGAATACGDTCTDTDIDPAHCGACDHACAPGVACVAGACVPTCAAGESACGESCVSLANDEANCGACGSPCPAGQPCVYGQCVAASLHHVLISGQSLSVGSGSAVVSTEQPFGNVSFNTGVRAGADNLTSFIPLVETAAGGLGETIASGMANLVAELELADGTDYRILASAHGVGGQPYSALKKGTPPYNIGMAQVTAGATLAAALGETHAVRAVTIIHGETDHINNNLAYAENLLAWQSDYEADVQAITGQPYPVPMFLCQMSSYTRYGQAVSPIPGEQLAAARARPDRIYVVGPKYFLPYSDGVHLTGDGERWLGEFYAKVHRRVLIDGEPWRPLAPAAVTREGPAIFIRFDVPAPPLVFDETMVANPGNYGFEYTDTSGAPPAIVEVALVDDTTVRITLASEPLAGNRQIRYAYTGPAGMPAGPMTGARGNLRDSDATPSRHAYPLYNWAVHFSEPVP